MSDRFDYTRVAAYYSIDAFEVVENLKSKLWVITDLITRPQGGVARVLIKKE